MANLSTGNFETLVDSLAMQIQTYLNAKGTTNGSNTMSLGLYNNQNTIKGLSDIDQEAKLAPAFEALYNALQNAGFPLPLQELYLQAIGGIKNAVGGSISTFCTANSIRVHPNIQLIDPSLVAAAIFPIQSGNYATYNVTGSGAGTFTSVNAINGGVSNGYANLNVKAVNGIGAASNVLTVIGTDQNGNAQTKTVTVPASTTINTLISVPGQWNSVTNITCNGGTNGDQLALVNILDRVIAL